MHISFKMMMTMFSITSHIYQARPLNQRIQIFAHKMEKWKNKEHWHWTSFNLNTIMNDLNLKRLTHAHFNWPLNLNSCHHRLMTPKMNPLNASHSTIGNCSTNEMAFNSIHMHITWYFTSSISFEYVILLFPRRNLGNSFTYSSLDKQYGISFF